MTERGEEPFPLFGIKTKSTAGKMRLEILKKDRHVSVLRLVLKISHHNPTFCLQPGHAFNYSSFLEQSVFSRYPYSYLRLCVPFSDCM